MVVAAVTAALRWQLSSVLAMVASWWRLDRAAVVAAVVAVVAVQQRDVTPLIFAAWAGRTDIVNLLLTVYSFDLDIVDNAGKTATNYAIANGRNKIVTLLLRRKLHPTTTTTEVLDQALTGME